MQPTRNASLAGYITVIGGFAPNSSTGVSTGFPIPVFIRLFDRPEVNHYAVSHTGLCLGFDIPDASPAYDIDVHYQPNVLQIKRRDDVNLDLVTRLLRTKHESWSYEQEVRVFVALNDPPDAKGLWWFDFGPQLDLREVIIGSQCSPAICETVVEALKP